MKKIPVIVLAVWEFFVSLLSPSCLGIAYMNIVGYGKGYDYDLGTDKPFFMMFGWIMLIIWALISIPGLVWLTGKAAQFRKKAAILPLLIFLVGVGIGVVIIGPDKFGGFFGIK